MKVASFNLQKKIILKYIIILTIICSGCYTHSPMKQQRKHVIVYNLPLSLISSYLQLSISSKIAIHHKIYTVPFSEPNERLNDAESD